MRKTIVLIFIICFFINIGFSQEIQYTYEKYNEVLLVWWKTNLFGYLIAVLLVISCFFICLLRIRQSQKRQQILEQEIVKQTQQLQTSKVGLKENQAQKQKQSEEIKKLKVKLLSKDNELFMLEREMDSSFEELKTINEELLNSKDETDAANNDLRDFAHIISHDLKAPLRGINQLVTWLSEDYSDKINDEGKQYFALLNSRTKRMSDLIDGVLRYSKAARNDGDKEDIDLNIIVNDLIGFLAPPDNIKIIIDNTLPVVYAHKVRIHQLFQNLIGNAIKYNDKTNGLIMIGYQEEKFSHKFLIKDNGLGIPENKRKIIFKIFQTLSISENKESTGVGLSIVKKIVEMHGGKIWIESDVGQGSTFFFTLKKKMEVKN